MADEADSGQPTQAVAAATESLALGPDDKLTGEAEAVLTALRAALASDSEARVMLEDIVQGHRLGPDDGWFRVSASQTRYDWPAIATRYDRNADAAIDADEFRGSPEDFSRLDRDGDGAITEQDLAWRDHALAQTPGALLFRHSDRDGNGQVTREEFLQLFQELDTESVGYVSLDDMRQRFSIPNDTERATRADRPNRSTLILGLARQEIGSLQPGPAIEDAAPDFTLPSLGTQPVTLSSEIGAQPIVLIFGNFTCGPFRSHAGNLEKLYGRYRDRAKFFLVYVREAHPSDGWWMLQNRQVGIELTQPTSDADRCDVAGRCQEHLALSMPFLVDTVSDTVGSAYSGMPNRLYLIDREGRIAFKSGRGPFGFRPGELEQALIWLLADDHGGSSVATARTD